jgi:hypothetical protein
MLFRDSFHHKIIVTLRGRTLAILTASRKPEAVAPVRGGEKLAQSGRFEIGSGVMGLTVT